MPLAAVRWCGWMPLAAVRRCGWMPLAAVRRCGWMPRAAVRPLPALRLDAPGGGAVVRLRKE
jgi:hypothetical protein